MPEPGKVDPDIAYRAKLYGVNTARELVSSWGIEVDPGMVGDIEAALSVAFAIGYAAASEPAARRTVKRVR